MTRSWPYYKTKTTFSQKIPNIVKINISEEVRWLTIQIQSRLSSGSQRWKYRLSAVWERLFCDPAFLPLHQVPIFIWSTLRWLAWPSCRRERGEREKVQKERRGPPIAVLRKCVWCLHHNMWISWPSLSHVPLSMPTMLDFFSLQMELHSISQYKHSEIKTKL